MGLSAVAKAEAEDLKAFKVCRFLHVFKVAILISLRFSEGAKMLTGILGEKVKMSQRFAKNGKVLPVTEIKAGPVVVVQIKTPEKDGYSAVQLAYGEKKRVKKPILGIIKKAGRSLGPKVLAEVEVDNGEMPKIGEQFTVNQVLKPGDIVKVTGFSKGKGFTGVMKRWGFAGGPKTHGQTDRARAPGSIGQTTTIGRVFRGKKMAGRAGGRKITITNLQVLEVDSSRNFLVVSGSVPGAIHSILKIEKTGVSKKPLELFIKETKETRETNETREGADAKEENK